MIGYATLGTNDIGRAAAYYDALLAPLGGQRMMGDERYIAWGTTPVAPMLAVIKPYDGQSATVGNGTMVALGASSREQVDAVYRQAIELGSADEGAAGPRGPGFYAGYFRDLDGNKLAVFYMG